MEASLKKLKDFEYIFLKIPKYQREYKWQINNWKEFWLTIAERGLERLTSNLSQTDPIFMGALVLRELEAEPNDEDIFPKRNFPRYAVVDGQQRLVTSAVFIAVLRDFYFAENSERYNQITQSFLITSKAARGGSQSRRKIELQEQDQEAFDKILNRKNPSDWQSILTGTHRLHQLYSFFWKKLSIEALDHINSFVDTTAVLLSSDTDEENEIFVEGSQENQLEDSAIMNFSLTSDRNWESLNLFDPNVLLDIVTFDFNFAVVYIQEIDNEIAFEVFETLNTKGMELDTVDKFRNGYFMLHSFESDRIHNKYWKPLERKVEPKLEILGEFFTEETRRRFGYIPADKVYHKLMSSIKNSAIQYSIENSRPNEIRRRQRVEMEFKDIIDSLNSFWIVYKGRDELEGADPDSKEYGYLLDSLKKLITGPATPLILDVIKWSGNKRTNREIQLGVNNILKSIQNLLARRILAGIKPQQLRSLLSELPRKIREFVAHFDPSLTCTPENLSLYNEKLLEIMVGWGKTQFPNDNQLLSAPLRDVYNSTSRKQALLAVLWELERSQVIERRADKVPSFGRAAYNWSIEHILPKNQQSDGSNQIVLEWKNYWQNNNIDNIEIEFESVVNSLGNLTILTNATNSSVSTDGFDAKKDAYNNQTSSWLTRTVLEYDLWTPKEIKDRSEKLLKLAIEIWPYPDL